MTKTRVVDREINAFDRGERSERWQPPSSLISYHGANPENADDHKSQRSDQDRDKGIL